MTILLKNGMIYDGAGGAPFKSDIVIQNKRIARLGIFPKKDADIILDATGMMITPGLIDINFRAEGTAGIIHDPYQESLIRAGVTTVVGGNGGISSAPVLSGGTQFLKDWGLTPGFNLHWRSMEEFLSVLGKRGVGVNFGTLVGYSAIRNFFTNGTGRDLTLGEMESAKHLISRSLKDGAFGLSTDLASPHSERIPVWEILELAREAGKTKRVYATHVRYRDERFIAALREILEIGRETGASIEINHLQPIREFAPLYEEALALIEKETAQSQINFDVFPHLLVIVPIHSFLPDWLMKGDMKEILGSLKEREVKERVLKHLQKIKISDVVFAEMPPALKFLEGKSLEDFAKNHGLTKARAIFEIMTLTKLRANLFHYQVDKGVLEKFLANQRAIISGFHRFVGKHEGVGDFLLWAEKNAGLPPEKAIAKMTNLPAVKFDLEKRGLLKENYWADIVLWDNWKPKTVLINGSVVMRDGVYEKRLVGSVLKAA
jgi:N-acyl-D-amino-acid deacylase